MKSPAQHANDGKIRTQQAVVARLRKFGRELLPAAWISIEKSKKLWEDVEAYKFDNSPCKAKLFEVAFPSFNQAEVDAALKAGNNLNDLYDIALGKASIATNPAGEYLIGRKGHPKIIKLV